MAKYKVIWKQDNFMESNGMFTLIIVKIFILFIVFLLYLQINLCEYTVLIKINNNCFM